MGGVVISRRLQTEKKGVGPLDIETETTPSGNSLPRGGGGS